MTIHFLTLVFADGSTQQIHFTDIRDLYINAKCLHKLGTCKLKVKSIKTGLV